MYTDNDLDTAVSAGVLDAATASAFRQHVASQRGTPLVDEEHFRLVSGFNDVFVVVASGLLLVSVAWIGSTLAPALGAALVALTAWGLAEFFVRRRRMVLPAIVLMLAFVGGVFFCGTRLMGGVSGGAGATALGAVLALLAAGLHWWRFRVPITVAAGAAAAVAAGMAVLLAWAPGAIDALPILLFVAGLLVFGLALRWDASDPQRQTRRADAAFWLHLLAAPLLVHPVFTTIGVFSGEAETAGAGRALVVLALYTLIALVSLWVDRRALMVSSLGYVLYAFSALLGQTGVMAVSGLGFAITALVVGASLLLLSAFWQASRAAVVKRLPAGLQRRVAPLS